MGSINVPCLLRSRNWWLFGVAKWPKDLTDALPSDSIISDILFVFKYEMRLYLDIFLDRCILQNGHRHTVLDRASLTSAVTEVCQDNPILAFRTRVVSLYLHIYILWHCYQIQKFSLSPAEIFKIIHN
jgi:hypothetical protein